MPQTLSNENRTFEVKCDDCKRTIRMGSVIESYQGGICPICRAA